MKQPVYFQVDQSFQTLDYTYSFSKYSCIAWVYPLHIMFAYLVVITGLLAMVSRLVKFLTPYHIMFGRFYLIFMLWCMASSLLIYTNGLPMPILISFLYLLFSITIGWNAIRAHTNKLYQAARIRINQRINSKNQGDNLDIESMEKQQKSKILMKLSFKQRLFSYKMLHGVLMSFSWYQMAGRLMVTNPFTSFQGCWTYPAYKSEVITEKVYAVDSVSTPAFPMAQGLFLAMITIPTVVIIFLIAFFSTYHYYKADMKKNGDSNNKNISAVGLLN